jgi:hypothetical protein
MATMSGYGADASRRLDKAAKSPLYDARPGRAGAPR